MTSTTLMPVRVSLRRDPSGHSPDQLDPEPPAKRPRLQHLSSRRRKSSPDLLDTTTTENSSSAASPYKLSPHPLRRRTSTRRPLANNPTASPVTPRPTDRRILRNESHPTIAPASLYLRGGRESPDPLDTISPAATIKSSVSRRLSPAGRPSAAAAAAPSSSARRPRRSAPAPNPDPEPAVTPVQHEAGALSSNPAQSSQDATAQQTSPTTEQPSTSREQRRSLRSHDGGSRARSELAQYFPNYEELISFETPKPEFLAGSTTIKIIDDLSEPLIPFSSDTDTDTPFGNPLLNLHNCETIKLSDPLPPSHSNTAESSSTSPDPLSEETYFRPHRRNERQEKQLRNIERDHNQYEKQKLDRLLDDLQGHDWLRTMGITGHINDQERKHYETKRAHFIQEISAVLQKFKIWKEEEKRRKLEKDNKLIEEENNKDHTPETTTNDEEDDGDSNNNNNGTTAVSDVQSYGGDPPDPNDVDAWAARQLHQEARSATTTSSNATPTTGKKSKPSSTSKKSSNSNTMPPPPAPIPHLLPLPLEPDKPFTSFFSKPHLRELALSATNRKGRTRLAFGHPIPEMDEREFELPAEILTPEAIDSCRRKRRRMKRASGRGETETG
ncbi:hypothetical protein BO94DRAFT_526331 [Aspergillus sclerotioniger CBS 115572]|uniref:Something about silencing protein 4 domain-containing protein n=1 Tax=Aspergillus sclerotioniger CBS 115572 TaxID=1450535 RepID=A0A317VCT7_9EURO|nr:hypothetical protein BO94DRAFT_526331 [Aspergillus sclerotioniger CBS 115572]PWY71061.1 hypothetical protein BO94DRAFT_526331 [Aspergillus sclerotioniger CBS 115572]